MRRIIIVMISIFVLSLLFYLVLFQPHILKNTWLWIVGFAGLIWSGIRGLLDFLTPNTRSLKEIENSNKAIRLRMEEIKSELKEEKEKIARERAENHREIEKIKVRIKEQQSAAEQSEAELEKLRSMKYQDYMNTLAPEDRKKREEEIWNEVDFGL